MKKEDKGLIIGQLTEIVKEYPNFYLTDIEEFTKDAKKDAPAKPALQAAYVQESFYVGAENLEALVNIKSKNELIGDVIMLLQSPAKNVISALQSSGQTIHGLLKTLEER